MGSNRLSTIFLTAAIMGLSLCGRFAFGQTNQAVKVTNINEFNTAVKAAKAGDTIVLANGKWENVKLSFYGSGTAEAPITLRAETPGKVTLEGQSQLEIGGEYLVVDGLVFVNGYTTSGSVIEFRKDSQTLANHCRVTNCVIDNYNRPDRFDSDTWVMLYGKHNRFDHNYLTNKKNIGVTLAVRLNDERSQENHHRIDHNFFGNRPRLGSNGGETLRVGTSKYSLTSSRTVIEENYFYHCNGETEIVSIKACDNIIRRNTFYECEGALVMRHGNRNIIEGNFFIGNNRPETGGIRVINAGHRIFNNYFVGLAGSRFRSALAVMNGVPNSLINRYHKVQDVIIAHNTFVDCANIQFGVGSDFERTDVPENVRFANNLIVNPQSETVYTALDDISGIHFANNIAQIKPGAPLPPGFAALDVKPEPNPHGLVVPGTPELQHLPAEKIAIVSTDITGQPRPDHPEVGAVQFANRAAVKPFATAENTGVRWYQSPPPPRGLDKGRVIAVTAGKDAIYHALQTAAPGDIIELQEGGRYECTQTLEIRHPLTIRAAAGLAEKPLLVFVGETQPFSFISIENGGQLRVAGLAFDGNADIDVVAESAIRSSKSPMIEIYRLFVENCDFYDFQESRFNAFTAHQSTFADTVSFTNCTFRKMSGDAISMSAEKEDRGRYPAEFVFLENCVFRDVMGSALNLYRGGHDESTFGPFLWVNHCVFDNVDNKEQGAVLRLIGVQFAEIKNCIFLNSGRGGRSIKFEERRWDRLSVSHCNLYNSGRVESFYDNVTGAGMMSVAPSFIDPENMDYRLQPGSPLRGKASDGGNIGLAY